MKRNLVAILAASILAAAMPAVAAEQTGANCLKDCQMLAGNCSREMDTIQSRISRLKKELGKGTAVYTKDELRKLEQKLEDAQETLEGLTHGG